MNEVFDYPYILSLADFISRSSTASKDAARALRKELKYGAPDTQERAIRLIGILLRNSDTRFKRKSSLKYPFLAPSSHPPVVRRGDSFQAIPGRIGRSRRQQENATGRTGDDSTCTLSPGVRISGPSLHLHRLPSLSLITRLLPDRFRFILHHSAVQQG